MVLDPRLRQRSQSRAVLGVRSMPDLQPPERKSEPAALGSSLKPCWHKPLPRIRRNWAPMNVLTLEAHIQLASPATKGCVLVAVCQLMSHSLHEIIAVLRLVDG